MKLNHISKNNEINKYKEKRLIAIISALFFAGTAIVGIVYFNKIEQFIHALLLSGGIGFSSVGFGLSMEKYGEYNKKINMLTLKK